jgi:hypothetical protein
LLTPFCIIYQLKPPRMSSGCCFVNLLYFDLIYYIAVGKRNLHCCPILAYFSTSTLISMNNPLGLSCSSRYLIIIPVVIFSLKSTNYKRILIEGGRYQTHTRKTSFYKNKYWIISLIIIDFIPSHQNLSSYICPWLFFLPVITSLILLPNLTYFQAADQQAMKAESNQRANHSISLNTTGWLLRMKGYNGLTGGVYPFGRNFPSSTIH